MRKYCVFLVAVALAACSNVTQSSLPATLKAGASVTHFVQQPAYSQLYSFKGMPDGAFPQRRLLNVGGVLYGTTNWGGAPNRGTGQEQTGTIFKWSRTEGERIVHAFQDFPDGSRPIAPLINVQGDLYGTTYYGGGPKQRGTVFKVSASGIESVVYRFNGPRDGTNPASGLTYQNRELFGTTALGGSSYCSNGCGTIYAVTFSGYHTVLYRFKAGNDGSGPVGNLIYSNGKFYGTCLGGGYSNHGVVFEMTPSGAERVIHQFTGEPDGSQPAAGLTNVNGEFYGTTANGGTKLGGTVYKIDSSGHESVIYNFPRNSAPQSGLLYVNGALYGTTASGGVSHRGTVFKVTLEGKGSILYAFTGSYDGKTPTAGLIDVDGTLYGTTSRGGTTDNGTLFRISP